jgi:ubiquinone/menaquinone biosynthesis C-methylase UbiE
MDAHDGWVAGMLYGENMSENISISPKEIYDESGCTRYSRFVDFFFYPQGIRDFIFRRIALKGGDRVLDAGCGFGILSKAIHDRAQKESLDGVEQHAFDLSPDMLAAFDRMGLEGIDSRRLDVLDLPYAEDSFDLIVTSAMLEHVPEIEKGLASLGRCLKPGGRIFVFMSRKSWINDLLFRPFGAPKCYSLQELSDLFTSVGLVDIQRRAFPAKFFWLNWWGYIVEASK